MPATLHQPIPANHRLPAHPIAQKSALAYFVTLCTHERQCLFGEVIDGQMQLSPLGTIVTTEWERMTHNQREITCEQWVIMPNHLHCIITYDDPQGMEAQVQGSDPRISAGSGSSPQSDLKISLTSWLDAFKKIVSQRVMHLGVLPRNDLRPVGDQRLIWQPTNDQRLIPHHFALQIFSQYIRSNPHSWLWDKLHPDSPSSWLNSEVTI